MKSTSNTRKINGQFNFNTDLGIWLSWKKVNPKGSVEISAGHIIDQHRDVLARFSDNIEAKAMMERCGIPITNIRGEHDTRR